MKLNEILSALWNKEKFIVMITFLISVWAWFFLTSTLTAEQETVETEVQQTEVKEKPAVNKEALKEDTSWNVNILFVWLPSTPENKNNLVTLVKVNRKWKQVSAINLDNRLTFNWVQLLKSDRESLFSTIKSIFNIETLYTVELDLKTLESYISASNWAVTLWTNSYNVAQVLEQAMTQFVWENWKQQQVLQTRFVLAMLWQLDSYNSDLLSTSTKKSFSEVQLRELFNTFKTRDENIKIVPQIFSVSDKPWRVELVWKNYIVTQSWLEELKRIK